MCEELKEELDGTLKTKRWEEKGAHDTLIKSVDGEWGEQRELGIDHQKEAGRAEDR